jgi:hypothetical protein
MFGRRHFSETPDLEPVCHAAEAAVGGLDPSGLALYAAVAAEPLPDDIPARALQLAAVLRELRGSVHLLALVAAGVEPRVAHFYRRPGDFQTFGYSEEEEPTLTDDIESAIAGADVRTDELMAAAYGVLSADERAALALGVDRMARALKGT